MTGSTELGSLRRFNTVTLQNLVVTGNETITGNLAVSGTLTAPSIIGSIAVAAGFIATADNGTTQTLTAPMVTGSTILTIHTSTGGSTPSLTMPLATAIIAANSGWAVGDAYTLRILNANSGTATILTNTGITLSGTATIPAGGQADFVITMTAAATVDMVRASATPVTLESAQTFTGIKTFTTPVLGAATGTSLVTTGVHTAKSATAVPATAGAVAAGAPFTMFSSNISIWVTSDAPTHTATKGDLCINTGGSSSSTRLFINNGTTNWIAVTTAT